MSLTEETANTLLMILVSLSVFFAILKAHSFNFETTCQKGRRNFCSICKSTILCSHITTKAELELSFRLVME